MGIFLSIFTKEKNKLERQSKKLPVKNLTKVAKGKMAERSAAQAAGEPHEVLYKVVLMGKAAVGKTSLSTRYISNNFNAVAKTTLGVDFAQKKFARQKVPALGPEGEERQEDAKTVEAEVDITLQLWDVAGQEYSTSLSRVYFANAVGAVIVCSADDLDSFECAKKWKKELDTKVFLPDGVISVPCVLFVNKCDTEGGNPKSQAEMKAFCVQHGFVEYYEVSAKEGTNVEKGFNDVVKLVGVHHPLANDVRLRHLRVAAQLGRLSRSNLRCAACGRSRQLQSRTRGSVVRYLREERRLPRPQKELSAEGE